MQNLYLLLGVFIVLSIVFGIVSFVLNKKLKVLRELNEELNAKLSYQNMENLKKEEEIKHLKNTTEEFKELKLKSENLEEKIRKTMNEKTAIEVELREIQKQLSEKLEEIEELKTENKHLFNENLNDKTKIEELQTKLEEMRNSYEDKIKTIKEAEKELKTTFENLANEILENTKDKLQKSSKENLSQILEPLKTQMKEFKEKVEFLSKEEASKISVLQNELKNLKDLSLKLSSDAENLTKALKGESKTQGNWGEMVLERVLELSGLRKGIEYKREVSLKDNENRRYRPDVIVHLPNERDVIIDAKTSLNAYMQYINTEDKTYIKAHIQAIRNHIDKLAEKKYENLEGVNTLDFIFMFVPIENALMLALENDTGIFEYAFKKKVVLVSPSTLLVSLRAIESSWRFERQAKNIEEVVKAAENLYDKVRGFSEDFVKIGESLDSAKNTYEKAKNKLTQGKGNVLRQIELLKEKAGIKPKKEIPQKLKEITQGASDE